MLNAGDLDRRIVLQRQTSVPDGFNEPQAAWSTVATVWASKSDVSDAERTRAAETAATIDTRFRIRWSSTTKDVQPGTWRVLYGSRTYTIVVVKEIGRREGLELSAAARAETPTP